MTSIQQEGSFPVSSRLISLSPATRVGGIFCNSYGRKPMAIAVLFGGTSGASMTNNSYLALKFALKNSCPLGKYCLPMPGTSVPAPLLINEWGFRRLLYTSLVRVNSTIPSFSHLVSPAPLSPLAVDLLFHNHRCSVVSYFTFHLGYKGVSFHTALLHTLGFG